MNNSEDSMIDFEGLDTFVNEFIEANNFSNELRNISTMDFTMNQLNYNNNNTNGYDPGYFSPSFVAVQNEVEVNTENRMDEENHSNQSNNRFQVIEDLEQELQEESRMVIVEDVQEQQIESHQQIESQIKEENQDTDDRIVVRKKDAIARKPLSVEQIRKREEQRKRNRIAAAKCRKKKIQTLNRLRTEIDQFELENAHLNFIRNKLFAEVLQNKRMVLHHLMHECQINHL